jgi:hypothetical protein
MKMVLVPQSDLDAIEQARVELFKFMEIIKPGFGHDYHLLSNVLNITEPMWKAGNKRYKEIKE